MDSILVSKTPDRYQGRRHLKLTDHRPIPPKYYKVLALHLAGKSCKDICTQTGYKDSTVYGILADERVVQIRQQLLKETEKEFEALYPKAVDNLRLSMNSEDPQTYLKGTDMYLRASGKYSGEVQKQTINVTAEDVVFQILNQNQSQQEGHQSGIREAVIPGGLPEV